MVLRSLFGVSGRIAYRIKPNWLKEGRIKKSPGKMRPVHTPFLGTLPIKSEIWKSDRRPKIPQEPVRILEKQ